MFSTSSVIATAITPSEKASSLPLLTAGSSPAKASLLSGPGKHGRTRKMLTNSVKSYAKVADAVPMVPIRITGANRGRAVRLAVLGNVLPVLTAVATQLASHRLGVFIGAARAFLASVLVSP